MDIFAKIAAGEIPSYKVAENDEFYAFLDINPLVKGHTLVIPRREVDYFFDMDDDELARYQQFAKQVAIAIKKAFPCKKVAQVVLGLEVAHAHIHLIPMQSEADADFRREKLKLSEEEFKGMRAADMMRLLTKTLSHEKAVSEHFGKKVLYPYLDRKVVDVVDRMDMRDLMPGDVRKESLRKVAESIGQPEVAAKMKKAAQYGSGAMNLFRRIARSEGKTVNDMIREWSDEEG